MKTETNTYAFREHGDASYFGMGPWIFDGVDERGNIKMVPAENGCSYCDYVVTSPLDFNEVFADLVDEEDEHLYPDFSDDDEELVNTEGESPDPQHGFV